MIDFTGVTTITIPEGVVTKIARGEDVLWETSSSSNAIVIYPATEQECVTVSGSTYINTDIGLSRQLTTTEKYIVYVNSIAHPITPSQIASVSTQLTLRTDDGYVELVATLSEGYSRIFVKINDELESPVLIAIHYIP